MFDDEPITELEIIGDDLVFNGKTLATLKGWARDDLKDHLAYVYDECESRREHAGQVEETLTDVERERDTLQEDRDALLKTVRHLMDVAWNVNDGSSDDRRAADKAFLAARELVNEIDPPFEKAA